MVNDDSISCRKGISFFVEELSNVQEANVSAILYIIILLECPRKQRGEKRNFFFFSCSQNSFVVQMFKIDSLEISR